MWVTIASVAAGIFFGFLGGKVWILIPWGITGLIIGYFSKNSKKAVVNGSIFGFTAAFLFMVSGYNGAHSLISRVPFFALIGIIGALGGFISSFFGGVIRKGLKKK